MLNVNGLCRRRWVPVLGLVFCAVFTQIAWGGARAAARAAARAVDYYTAADYHLDKGVLPCVSMTLKVRYLMNTIPRTSAMGAGSRTRWNIGQIQKFVQKGRDVYKEEARRLRASDSDEDKEKLKKLDKDMENFPYCNGDPLHACVGKMQEHEALGIRSEVLSDETLRELYSPDPDLMLHTTAYINNILYDFLVTNEAISDDKFGEKFEIKYPQLSKVLLTLKNKNISDDLQWSEYDKNVLYDFERQMLKSEKLRNTLVKTGGLEYSFPDRLRKAVSPKSHLLGKGEDYATVQGQAVSDFVELVRILQDPNNPIEWTPG